MTVTIKHTRQHGTLAYGTVRGDGSGKILYRYNFRPSQWLPVDAELGDPYWYLPHSRRRSADSWRIGQAKTDLEAAGFTVQVTVDNATPATGFDDLENERYERAEARADRYRTKAGAADTKSETIRANNQRTYDALAGTPVLIGHYSEKRHRKLLDRLWAREGKAWELYDRAKQWRAKAQAAERFQHRREDPRTTQRRIAGLEARLRKIDRDMAGRIDRLWDNPTDWPGPLDEQLQGYRDKDVPVTILGSKDSTDGTRTVEVHIGVSEQAKAVYAAEVVEICEEIGYWEGVLDASGVKVYTKDDVAKGDFVHVKGRWLEALKVSAKSVTVPDRYDRTEGELHTWEAAAAAQRHPHTSTVPYDEITGVLTRADAQSQYPAAFAAPMQGEAAPPRRTTAKRGKVKLEHSGGHDQELWQFRVGKGHYWASWPTPPHQVWYGPPTPIEDPAPIQVRRSTGLSTSEPVTELAVPAGIRWREDVQNVLRAWVEPWAQEHANQRAT